MKHNPSPTLIIVPDVHGRTFWKKIFDYDSEVVFLGDYLDPYSSEDLYPWDALENFTQIIAYAKAHPKVHLLLGNHDLCYSIGRHICNNRCDYENYDTIRSKFLENADLFQLAFDHSVNGRRFFLSHAGISFGWYSQHRDIFTYSYEETLRAYYINGLYRSGALNGILGEIGSQRGGRCTYGSMVWADINEMANPLHKSLTDIIQIIGHTQMASGLLNLEDECSLYDVDSRRCVCIGEDGNVRELT